MAGNAKGISAAISQEYPRTMYIDLDKSDAAIIKDLEVGSEVTLTVKGKVCGVSNRERLEDGKTKKCASIDLENPRVRVAPKNEFSDLAEDD